MVVEQVSACLAAVGYREDLKRSGVLDASGAAAAGTIVYSDMPLDARTAAVCVVSADAFGSADRIATLRDTGAPLVISCSETGMTPWQQSLPAPRVYHRFVPVAEIQRFFDAHKERLTPSAVYRAKAWGRLERSLQLDFVDVGLLPVVEREAGQRLTELVERIVGSTKRGFGWTDITLEQGQWLLQTHFWLLAAKILKDKEVPGFARLSLTDVGKVFKKLAEHYHGEDPRPPSIGGARRQRALEVAAAEVARFGDTSSVTTESLAYVYESALIDEVTRQELGTHSTPTWLVDYMLGRLRRWIEEIPAEERHVFEPACGHAGFLGAAMRLLSELLPAGSRATRRQYLRRRLRGMEIDPFALEVARLSMTLADVPNPNGWALTSGDVFSGDALAEQVRAARIVLANPPFENFGERPQNSVSPNKAGELFHRIVDNLPLGGVLGIVLPQTQLRSRQLAAARRRLLQDYEIEEVSLFADKVFRHGDAEIAVLLARRAGARRTDTVRYQRVREQEVEPFSREYAPSTVELVPLARLRQEETILPRQLTEVWDTLGRLHRLSEVAEVGKGFEHRSDDDPLLPPGTVKESDRPLSGLEVGFSGWSEEQYTHLMPRQVWLNTTDPAIRRPGMGLDRRPQILVNYGVVGRGVWRIKALFDPHGHPVTSRFVVLRPRGPLPLHALWAICNSPLSNAYVWCTCGKRDVYVRDLKSIPIPDPATTDWAPLERLVQEYMNLARSIAPTSESIKRHVNGRQMRLIGPDAEPRERLRVLHLRIDAEVLRLYDLPSPLERKLLDLFTGTPRKGVPFVQSEYMPASLPDLERLRDLLAITADWPRTRERRGHLIDLDIDGQASVAEQEELADLERLASAWIRLSCPLDTSALDTALEDLRRRA